MLTFGFTRNKQRSPGWKSCVCLTRPSTPTSSLRGLCRSLHYVTWLPFRTVGIRTDSEWVQPGVGNKCLYQIVRQAIQSCPIVGLHFNSLDQRVGPTGCHFIPRATVLAWQKPKISRVCSTSLSTTLYCIWLFISQLRLFNIPCPCKELNEQASARHSLSCRLCLMMSWITNSAQRWRFQGGAVTHYGREKKTWPLYLIDFEWAKLSINLGHGVINVRKRKKTDRQIPPAWWQR